jgi:hypothetical protein
MGKYKTGLFGMTEEEMDRKIIEGLAHELHTKISDYIVKHNKPKFRLQMIHVIEKGKFSI